MTDRHEEGAEATEQAMRRLLAAAARPDPVMPDQVVARLDDVLADLAREHGPAGAAVDGSRRGEVPPLTTHGSPAPDEPVNLDAQRVRRRGPQLLVAAAAVSVLGLGLGNVLGGLGGSTGQGDSAGGDASTAGGASVAESGETFADGDEHAPGEETEDGVGTLSTDPLPRLRSGSLLVDVERAQLFSVPTVGEERQAGCVRPPLQDGDELLPVRLDGEEAVLVLGVPREGVRRAEIYTCDDAGTPAAALRVDAP